MVMEINKELLDGLFEQAQANPRLRQNYDLRTSERDHSQRMLNALLPGAENGGYPPTQNGDIRSLFWLFSLMALQN